ncbi:hypothetical protein DAI22_03g241490 [Oryza sativa Japonica Group]|nr:hypothetical protein DAI22_03g241490 [Oryza sativa Japonica Group]
MNHRLTMTTIFFFAAAQIVHSYWHSVNAPRYGGSVMGHKVVDRNREARHLRLYQDYLDGKSSALLMLLEQVQ